MNRLLTKFLTRAEEKPRIEWRALRLLCYLSQLAFASWCVVTACVATDSSVSDDFWWPNIVYPMWAMLGFHALYYLYILVRKIRLSLLSLIAIAVFWGNAVAWCWVYMGTVLGLSVALGGAAYIGYALIWSGATIRILAITKGPARAAVAALGLALPLAVCGLAYSCWWWWKIRDNYFHFRFPANGIALMSASSMILVLAAVVSWRTRRAALRILATTHG